MRPSGVPSAAGLPGSPAGGPAGGGPPSGGNVPVPVAVFADLMAKINKAVEPVRKALDSFAAQLGKFGSYFGPTGEAIGKFAGRILDLPDTVGSAIMEPLEAMGAGIEAALAPIQRFSDAVTTTLRPFAAVTDAAWALMKPFQQLTGSVQPFMAALNPALARELEYSLRELLASVGLLIVPLAQELAPVLREVAAALQPVFRVLAPILGEMARVLGRIIALLARSFAQVLEAFAPVLLAVVELFSRVVVALSPLLGAFAALFAALAPIIKVMIEALTPILLSFAKAITYATAGLLKFFGATGALDGMIKSLRGLKERGPLSEGLQAIQSPQYSDPLAYGRSLVLAAAMAAPGGQEEKKTMDDLTKEILANLEEIAAGNTWGPLLKELKALLHEFGVLLVAGLKSGVYEVSREVGTTNWAQMTPLGPALNAARAIWDWRAARQGG